VGPASSGTPRLFVHFGYDVIVRIRERGGTLRVEDVPGMHWILGLLFVGVGSLFVAGPLGLFPDAGRMRLWLRAVTAALGAAAVAAGIWTLARSPRSRLTVQRARAGVRLEQWGIGGRAVREWPLAALAGVQLVESRDDEGGTVFQLHLILREARPVPLSPVWRHGRERMEHVARRLATELGVRPVNVRVTDA
jgi:hypothetical protein